jgi:Ca2+-binding RTX toxin-like protein
MTGNHKMFGTAGADLLDGHGRATVMTGYGGDDTYVVYHSSDTVVEAANAGVDTVRSLAPSYTLPANVENLTLTGTTPQVGIGNNLDNILTSNNAGSTLIAGSGNDILIAGKGPDTLTGGSGHDIFQFNNIPTQAGQVTNFVPGQDMLDLRQLFATAGYHGTNPVTDGYLSLVSDGKGDTNVLFDPHTGGLASGGQLVTTLDQIAPTQLHMGTDWFFS